MGSSSESGPGGLLTVLGIIVVFVLLWQECNSTKHTYGRTTVINVPAGYEVVPGSISTNSNGGVSYDRRKIQAGKVIDTFRHEFRSEYGVDGTILFVERADTVK